MITLPNIGPTVTSPNLRRTALEAIELTMWVCIGRGWFADHSADIDEMLLGRRTLLQLNGSPFSNEFVRCH